MPDIYGRCLVCVSSLPCPTRPPVDSELHSWPDVFRMPHTSVIIKNAPVPRKDLLVVHSFWARAFFSSHLNIPPSLVTVLNNSLGPWEADCPRRPLIAQTLTPPTFSKYSSWKQLNKDHGITLGTPCPIPAPLKLSWPVGRGRVHWPRVGSPRQSSPP